MQMDFVMPRDVIREYGYLTLGSRLKRIGEHMQADAARFMRDEAGIDMPLNVPPLLETLYREEALTVGELASVLALAQPGVTRTLNQLQADGLVETAKTDGDQRRRIVRLSDEGRALVERARRYWPSVEAAVSEMCSAFEGDLLRQIDRLEDELDRLPLNRRAAMKHAEAGS
jgi:DNA-binding MarR family transcriptional regulator